MRAQRYKQIRVLRGTRSIRTITRQFRYASLAAPHVEEEGPTHHAAGHTTDQDTSLPNTSYSIDNNQPITMSRNGGGRNMFSYPTVATSANLDRSMTSAIIDTIVESEPVVLLNQPSLSLPRLWRNGFTGRGVRIGIFDTGLNAGTQLLNRTC